jgi:hypothetical protein
MIDPIELQLVEPQPLPPPPVIPERARTQINEQQVQALISLIASANPALVILPESKQFSDIKGFNVRVLPNGKGMINVVF